MRIWIVLVRDQDGWRPYEKSFDVYGDAVAAANDLDNLMDETDILFVAPEDARLNCIARNRGIQAC